MAKKKITQKQWQAYYDHMEKHDTMQLDYHLRNIMVGDGEPFRIVEDYMGKSVQEIIDEVGCSEAIAQALYNYSHEEDEDKKHKEHEPVLEALLRETCWNIILMDKDFSLWEDLVLAETWDEFNEAYNEEEEEVESGPHGKELEDIEAILQYEKEHEDDDDDDF